MKKIKFIIPTVAIAATTLASVATVACTESKNEGFVYDADVQKETSHVVDKVKALFPKEGEEEFNPYQVTFSGFKLQDKRESLGLRAKVRNQSFSATDFKTEIVLKEDGVSFDVLVTPDVLEVSEIITFDLEFSNTKSGLLFTSKGYSINFRNPYANQKFINGEYVFYAFIDGEDAYFDWSSGLLGSNLENKRITAVSTGKKVKSWDRKTFNYKLYFSPSFAYGTNYLPEGFLDYCESFNQDIQELLDICGVLYDSPRVTYLTSSFMVGCKSFNQPLTFGNVNFTRGGPQCNYFMTDCDSMTSTITFTGDNLFIEDFPVSLAGKEEGFLITTNKEAPMYKTGITIATPDKPGFEQEIKKAFIDLDGVESWRGLVAYRKLIIAEEPTK